MIRHFIFSYQPSILLLQATVCLAGAVVLVAMAIGFTRVAGRMEGIGLIYRAEHAEPPVAPAPARPDHFASRMRDV